MAQYYPRIVNPYMPNGTPDLTNAQSPAYAPGEIGCSFNDQNSGGSYLRVYLDSGATSATPVGAVAKGQLAFWKNQGSAIVTNDQRMCDVGPAGACNRVAGVFQLAVTTAPGVNGTDGNPLQYYCDLVIQKSAAGGGYMLAAGSPLAGQYAVANQTSSNASANATAINTAPPTQPLGIWGSATAISGAIYPCDVNIGFVD